MRDAYTDTRNDLKNYYAILEVPVGCRLEEIRQSYHRLVQENMDSEDAFADLKEAYEVLTTPERREEYDRAAWGETFGGSAGEPVSVPRLISPTGRCPMGIDAQCPVLQGRLIASDKYCPECGFLLAGLDADGPLPDAAPMRQVWLEELGGQTHRLRTGLNIVGREGADVLLPDKTVSRQHARLDVGADGAVTVEDLSSTNGTAVGGDQMVAHVLRRLSGGDTVRFGSVATILRVAAPAEAAPPKDSPLPTVEPAAFEEAMPEEPETAPLGSGTATGARGQVVQSRDGAEQTHLLLPGITTFGRRTENNIVLPGDPYVSGSHAQIVAGGEQFQVIDVGSTNGTLLNGKRLELHFPVTLTDGDVILIGSTALRFERLSTPPFTVTEELPADVPEESPKESPEAPSVEALAETDPPRTETPETVEGTHP